MPVYAYRCQECDYGFDGINSVDNRHNVTCHKCGGPCRIEIVSVNYICLDYEHDTLGHIGGPRQKSRILKERGLFETDESYESLQASLPNPTDAILRSPESDREFLKIVEDVTSITL